MGDCLLVPPTGAGSRTASGTTTRTPPRGACRCPPTPGRLGEIVHLRWTCYFHKTRRQSNRPYEGKKKLEIEINSPQHRLVHSRRQHRVTVIPGQDILHERAEAPKRGFLLHHQQQQRGDEVHALGVWSVPFGQCSVLVCGIYSIGRRSRDSAHLAVPHRGVVPRVRHEYPAQRVAPDAVQERVPGEGPGEVFIDLFTDLFRVNKHDVSLIARVMI